MTKWSQRTEHISLQLYYDARVCTQKPAEQRDEHLTVSHI